MKDADVLFCRKTVVNRLSETVAFYILHPNSEVQGQDASFLSSLFVDVNLTEITQQKTIYFQTTLHELGALPLQTNINMVIFLSCDELTLMDFDSLSEFRLQGYQLGMINPDPKLFPATFFNVFSYLLFTLDCQSTEDVVEAIQHPSLSVKNIWVNKIEDVEQFHQLQNSIPQGQFSGNAIHKIKPVKGKRILAYKAILVDLLVALNNRESSPRALAEFIERDPTLTYRIIKLTHTVMYRSQFNVSNAQRAIEIIGIRDLIKWVSLVMFGSVPGKPDCLFPMAVSRACFCQNLSAALFPKLEGAFLVGLFSYLPSFLDEDLPSLLKDLPLDENIKTALLEYKGNLGGILKIVIAYEAGRWEKIPFDLLESKNISKQCLKELYIEGLKEAREMGNV
ncbi:HDOD domain-containing protein [Marinomonas rhizomae]|uniref:EAL and modified HD-GYP domain-containing signal transduction protein n=1 Tax=Marinomonas rhizomae TaxID=491948 RepID=A0A366JCN2_9GAMM|nr:HDOD domain-containing protein [Marinomonas rhizomae]RBP84732.1 EAL and modified HD-GYP domain-containing signal transduction protein [Marinomonas rhizomae]RNF75069.1 HDOD domain-containing protein [Marinomonas rhizomae]